MLPQPRTPLQTLLHGAINIDALLRRRPRERPGEAEEALPQPKLMSNLPVALR